MDPVPPKPLLAFSAFLARAQALAEEWHTFTAALNEARQARRTSHDPSALMTPALAGHIRLACAMQVLRDIYVIIPDAA